MKVRKKTAEWKKLGAFTTGHDMQGDIYSPGEFQELLKYERIRSDRTNSSFSLVLFTSPDLYASQKNIQTFISTLRNKIRLIDHIGWYKTNQIAVLLPDTGKHGAVSLCNKIFSLQNYNLTDDNIFKIYTYPENWLQKGPSEAACHGQVTNTDFNTSVENGFTFGMPLWKRILDITLSSAGLIITLPVFILLPVFMKIVSPGPVFFQQPRVGYKGKTFRFWKFRTMRVDNNQSFHGKHSQSFIKNGDIPMEKLDNRDPRIFPGGRVIRKSCIDELPQLWNVLRGEMSLVGPRPCIPYEAEEYLRWHTHRFDVVPGLTGLWQVSGKNKLTFKQMIRLDITYSENLSLWNDLRIILVTPFAIAKMMGEAAVNKLRGHYLEQETGQNINALRKTGTI